jgi:hypothetical protein
MPRLALRRLPVIARHHVNPRTRREPTVRVARRSILTRAGGLCKLAGETDNVPYLMQFRRDQKERMRQPLFRLRRNN